MGGVGAGLVDGALGGDRAHELAAPAERGERHAATQRLPERDEIGPDAEALRRPARREPEAGDHLVEDEQRPVRVAARAEPVEEAGLGRHAAHVPGHGLDDDRGDAPRRVAERPRHVVEVVEAGDARVGRRAVGDAGRIRNAGRRSTRAGADQERVAMAVVAARELEHARAAGRRAGKPERAHRRLGSGRDEADHVAAGHHPGDALRQLHLGRRHETEQRPAPELARDRLGHALRAVPEERRPPRADPVQVLAAGGVAHARAARLDERDGRQAHRAERPHRRVDPARGDALRAFVERGHDDGFQTAQIHRCASAARRPSASRSAMTRAK